MREDVKGRKENPTKNEAEKAQSRREKGNGDGKKK